MNDPEEANQSRWSEIIECHRRTHQLGPWGRIPRDHFLIIAEQCGEQELTELRQRLEELDVQFQEIPEWDEEALDDIWHAKEMFVTVLRHHGQFDMSDDGLAS